MGWHQFQGLQKDVGVRRGGRLGEFRECAYKDESLCVDRWPAVEFLVRINVIKKYRTLMTLT